MNVCPVCKLEMKLTRVEINKLKQLIAKTRANKYFLSDETTMNIIHQFHGSKKHS